MLSLSLSIHQECEVISDDQFETIFKGTEEMLNETKYQKALIYISDHETMNKYRSMMDFLFCELFPKYKKGCFNYYEDEDKYPRLKNILDKSQIEIFDGLLQASLEVAYSISKQKEEKSWIDFRKSSNMIFESRILSRKKKEWNSYEDYLTVLQFANINYKESKLWRRKIK